jgi:hypothetical protein
MNQEPRRSVDYLGKRSASGCRVIVETGGRWWPLQHVESHSPGDFEWGTDDCGPIVLDLALSILVHTLQDRAPYRRALGLHEAFSRDVVAGLHDNWRLPQTDVLQWIAVHDPPPTS